MVDEYVNRKNLVKRVRTYIEAILVVAILLVVIRAFFFQPQYHPETTEVSTQGKDHGFVALSYFGVDRVGTDTLISSKLLNKHLQALKANGYVTITQDDILDYYTKYKQLPEKAVYLMFEDGRTDTTIFSQKALENANYIATIYSYADNLTTKDDKFLTGKDLKKLKSTSYWETGSNGYRLAYINVFDRYEHFLGQMTSDEFIGVRSYLGRDYNHYLMDYIRDENWVPMETKTGMVDRITYDYELMEENYTKEVGEVPKAYALMHANTARFGNNDEVSDVNERCMKDLFRMNFNREGESVNDADLSLYDLTRMQAQAYWSTNHLLMRLRDDLDDSQKGSIQFVVGDERRSKNWEVLQGAAEFDQSKIILTSLPKDKGIMKLKPQTDWQDVSLEVNLKGNLQGTQTLRLAAQDENSGISLSFQGKNLTIYDNGTYLRQIDLDSLLGVTYLSEEEDSRDAVAQAYEVRSQSADDTVTSLAFKRERDKEKAKKVKTVEDGAKPYVPQISLSTTGDWKVKCEIHNRKLTVYINDKVAIKDLPVKTIGQSLYLASEMEMSDEYSQRNLTEDVYDGVFEDLVIYINQQEQPFCDNRLHGFEKFRSQVQDVWDSVINWFVENM